MYAEIAPVIPLRGKTQTYTYSSKQKLSPGIAVTVPFGRRNVKGVVITTVRAKPRYKTKDILKASRIALTPDQLALAAQIARFTQGGLGYTLRLFFPKSQSAGGAIPKLKQAHIHKTEETAWIGALTDRQSYLREKSLQVLKNGEQMLIVVPERWMADRFEFAESYHAGLSTKQQNTIWKRIASGAPTIVVGTQKSLFLPWRNLSTIVVDELQLSTHKLWDQYPRLDNRRLAKLASDQYHSSLIWTGSFPSIWSHHAEKEKYITVQHNKPISLSYSILAPSLEDRRSRLLIPNDAIIKIRSWLKKKERILLLVNEKEGRYRTALKKLHFTHRKGLIVDTNAIFTKVDDTQFDRVLWLAPERTLSYPHFRSREEAYTTLARLQSLLKPRRKCVLITRNPELIERILPIDIGKSYEEILVERKKYKYPPYTDMVRLLFTARTKQKAEKLAQRARQDIEKKAPKDTRILGPYSSLNKREQSYSLLLLGSIEKMADAYTHMPVTTVDVDPAQIL